VRIPKQVQNRLLLLGGFFVLFFVGRLVWFYRGSYIAPDIPEVDDSQIAPLLVDYHPFEDEPWVSHGRVLIDLSHANNLDTNDLAPLLGRLEARGVTVETFDGAGDATIEAFLHSATALLVVAPTEAYEAEDRDVIVDFVEDGGRVLLAADPTRSVLEEDEGFLILSPGLCPVSAVPAINSLANAFGVVYFDDYLYNLDENEGNYRNVRFTVFSDDHALVQDLETVVFFAAHSLRSNGLSLIVGDEQTRSPVRSGEAGLAVATLTVNGQALALGDVTFLTAPYHTIGDNDRLLSHIADWLAVDGRVRDELADFPYLFQQPVDLIQFCGDAIDARLIAHSTALQECFDRADLSLSLRAEATPGHDVLFVGTFDDVVLVQDYLDAAGVTVVFHAAGETHEESGLDDNSNDESGSTVIVLDPAVTTLSDIGETVDVDVRVEGVSDLFGAEAHLTFDPALLEVVDSDAALDGVQIQVGTFLNPYFLAQNLVDQAAGEIDFAVSQGPDDRPVSGDGILATIPFKGEALGTSAVDFKNVVLADDDGDVIPSTARNGSVTVGEGAEPVDEEGGGDEAGGIEKEEPEAEEGLQGCIEIETLGTVSTRGMNLFVIDRSADRVILIVMAEDGATVITALERLIANDLSGCARIRNATICSTGETQAGSGLDADNDAVSSDEGDSRKRIFVLSSEDASDGMHTGAAELESILGESYDVTVWSTGDDGLPASGDLAGYEAYILASGDYAFDEDSTALSVLDDIETGGVMLVGAQILPSFDETYEPINDLRLVDASHPLAAGFAAEETLALLPSESGIPAAMVSDAQLADGDASVSVVFTRGPDSLGDGAPALIAFVYDDESEGGTNRAILATFAFYRLPADAQRTLALNAARWLTDSDS
jgi:hypothetical protein